MGTSEENVTLAKIIMWGILPLLTLVFVAGGGWWRMSDIEVEQASMQEQVDRLSDNMIAVCIATGAECER